MMPILTMKIFKDALAQIEKDEAAGWEPVVLAQQDL